jgi:hypothetical protein
MTDYDNTLPDDTNNSALDAQLSAEEPPVSPDDTKPRAPVPLAAEEPPSSALDDTAESLAVLPGPARRPLLLATVMIGSLCLCLMLIGFAGFAGYRDGLATNDAQITRTLATDIAQQYATGVAELDNGYAEMAAARFEWIVETVQAPTEYALDSRERLAIARTLQAYTPTAPPSLTPTASPTAPPTVAPTESPEPQATDEAPTGPDPETLYEQASQAMGLARYEDAIEWLESLRALAPDYRTAEVTAMYLEALTTQGKIYLRGQNQDGEDRLQRGVLLIYRADEIGTVEPPELLGEANFVEMYLNARSYVSGGNYAAALPVLEQLCDWNCGWSYHNVSVRDLLEQAQQGGQ